MTWRATCPMNERMNFIVEIERAERSVSEICRQFGSAARRATNGSIDLFKVV